MASQQSDQVAPTWEQFENLVKRVLEVNRYTLNTYSPRGDAGFDFYGLLDDESWAIEVKYYRTARFQPSLVEAALNRLASNAQPAGAVRGMLVVSCAIPKLLLGKLEAEFGVVLVDRERLIELAAADLSLAEELDVLFSDSSRPLPEIRSETPPFGSHSPLLDKALLLKGVSRPVVLPGHGLCEELKALKAGNKAWSAYEKLCARVLSYLFPNDLRGWHKQKRTDDGLNRFDFVCRVQSVTDFWNFIVDHLGSRYAIFEFKNYSSKIKQDQILTTEKYLFERGLRKVAIIFTRLGADKGAVRMAQGAMREHGKLLLVIDDKDVCNMLHMKDRGEDPSDHLFLMVDNFLLKLSR